MDPEDNFESGSIELGQLRIRERASLVSSKLKANLFDFLSLQNLINATFILSVSSLCLLQCYSQIKEYLEFKTRIQLTHALPKNTVLLLPGVTICNNNRLRLDKLAEEIPSIKDDVAKVLNGTMVATLTDRRRIGLLRSIKRAVDDEANITKILIESPIRKLMEMSRSSMIKDINCNTAWGEQINCENLRIVESFQGSPCYTAFYLGSLLEAMSTGKAFDFKSSLINGTRKLNSFESHEIGEIIIDFDPLQHGDTHQDIGGKLSIHSTAHVGSIKDVAYTILPGYRYEIIIERSMSKRLPPPYDTKCYDYKRKNSPKFFGDQLPGASVELDKTTCTRNCITRLTTEACDCWPIEVPWYPGDKGGSRKLCAWGFDEVNTLNFSSANYVNCYRKFHAECRTKCRPGCRTEDYSVQIIRNPWPGRDRFLVAANTKEAQELSRLRGCCSLISIKYSDLIERRNIMIPNLTLAQLVSNIGGIVSALVGVSSLTIYRYITRRVLHCRTVSDSLPEHLVH
uniref:Amiloride-sensitive cation channel 2, neuronal n=1 Tax=Aceria tosichella TaxID=561515 RepID=A0A6G1S798_9ACAR